jgi:hypothetical protein
MRNENEIMLAWKIWHLVSRLNDLIWDHYEDEFVRLCQQYDQQDWRNLSDHIWLDHPEA